MEPLDVAMEPEIDAMLEKVKAGKPLMSTEVNEDEVISKKTSTGKAEFGSTYMRRYRYQGWLSVCLSD